jgi:hypothetical protein
LVFLVAGLYAAILFLALLFPIYLGVGKAYRQRRDLLEALHGQKEIKDSVIEELLSSPEGIPGFGRMLMTLGVVMILGISIFHVLVMSTTLADIGSVFSTPTTSASFNQTLALAKDLKTQELSIVNNLLTILGGAVSAIIGFYFGAKTAESKADTTGAPTPETGKPPPAKKA